MIKKSFLILASAILVFASEGSDMQQMSGQDMFNILKPQMSKMYDSVIPMIEKAEECFQNAKTKEAAVKCSETMMQESAKFMPPGMAKEAMNSEDYKNFEWNDEVRKKTVEDLRKSKIEMQKMQKCINNSKTMKDMDLCMKEIGVEKR